MIHNPERFDEGLQTPFPSAHIFGRPFRPEKGLVERLAPHRSVEGYLDGDQVEHIRVYTCRETSELPEDLWEVLSYQDEEAPLELLLEAAEQGSGEKG